MFSKVHTFLKQPFPFEMPVTGAFLSNITAGLFVSLFLLIFQPFGAGDYIAEGRTWILWGYGLVTFMVLIINVLVLPSVLPAIFNETKWNILKSIIFQFWNIISIGTANLLFAKYIGGKNLSIMDIPEFLLTALAIGFFPVIFGIFSIYVYLLNKYTGSSKRINNGIVPFGDRREKSDESPETVIITSETGKDTAKINLKTLLFVKSVDNYVEIYCAGNEKIEKTLLRSSLKRIEKNLNDYPCLFKCHRAYLINVNNISNVTGNSQGYKLKFKEIENLIPVSRNYSKKFIQLVE